MTPAQLGRTVSPCRSPRTSSSGTPAAPPTGGTPVVLALDVADADGVVARAVAAGAEVRQPVQDMSWGDRHGQIEDPFGHRWNVSQHVRDVPHDEVVAAAAKLFGAAPGRDPLMAGAPSRRCSHRGLTPIAANGCSPS